MFMKVMVGIDEETRGRDAAMLAARLSDPAGEVTFVHVQSYPLIGLGTSILGPEDPRELLEAAAHESGIHAKLRAITAASTGAGLHRVCEEIGADLVVVGSTQRSRMGRVFLGDATSQALNGATCAVAVAPSGYAENSSEILEIGVAFNGSPESLNAIAVARLLAREMHAHLSAFEAVEMPLYASSAGTWGTHEEITGEDLAAARHRIEELGSDVDAHVSCGEAVRQLAIYSDSVDLLVAGSRGYGPLGRLVHGSTTRRLARVARCPLLILPRSDLETGGDPAKLVGHEHRVLA